MEEDAHTQLEFERHGHEDLFWPCSCIYFCAQASLSVSAGLRGVFFLRVARGSQQRPKREKLSIHLGLKGRCGSPSGFHDESSNSVGFDSSGVRRKIV